MGIHNFLSVLCVIVSSHFVIISGKPPHIVFIVADDLGWNDVGWHNPDIISPNLDKLAKAGVILNSSYVQPICSPSRNCFMSGYYPYHTGLQNRVIFANKQMYMPENITTLPQKLKELGYATHMVGKWHLGYCNIKYTPTHRGFDSFFGFYNGNEDHYTHVHTQNDTKVTGYDFRFNTSVYYPEKGLYSTHVLTNRAIDIINRTDPLTDKLFLYLPFQVTHEPLQVPQKYENMYSNISSKERRVYCGMVSAMDEAIGNITEVLKAKGFMDNLLLIFTTDNGGAIDFAGNNYPLRGGKVTLWEGGTRGAAFVYSPTLLEKVGYTNTGMIHAVDWFPTLVTVAGGIPDPSLDGINQWETIRSNQPSNRTEFIYNIDDVKQNAAIRVGDFKLIVGKPGSPNYNGWYGPPENNFNKRFLLMKNNSENFHFNTGSLQLYNIKDDPTEHHDLSSQNSDIVQQLQERLEEYKKTLVPSQNPPVDPRSDPTYFGGVWSPGWC